MTLHEANRYLFNHLKIHYDEGEATQIAELVMEKVTGNGRMARIKNAEENISADKMALIEKYAAELSGNKPVQYVLNEAWFANMKFYVDEHVLIPRPETEELVAWVVDDVKKLPKKDISILDIGTGSGCIAIAIKKYLPEANVLAIDISDEALKVAQKNARANNVHVVFSQADILDEQQYSSLPDVDIIVSNPPYIPLNEKLAMHTNVVNFEPHVALFVPDNNPLLFYSAIARFAETKSAKHIYFEIHQHLGEQLKKSFGDASFKTELRKDLNENDRLLKLTKQ